MDKATELPIQDCDITIRVGRDGVWLSLGAHTAFHVMNTLGDGGHIIGNNVAKWCVEREQQAKEIEADNGQFGVGA